jgi:hypothetical protein
MWPVEFWTTDYLRSKPLVAARLRYNSTDAKQGSSFGDDFAVLHKVWDVMSDEQKSQILSQKAFTNFLGHLLPGSSVATTWLPLLKHDDWRTHIERVFRIPWGRSVLVASQLTRAFACHYPDPFFSIITAAMNWFHEHFEGLEELVDAEDMQYLIQKSSDFSQFNMLALFFPIWDKDFKVSRRGRIEGNMHRLSKGALQAAIERGEKPAFVPLATPFEFRGLTYPNQRPDFLSLLSDTEYIDLFMRLHRLDERGAFPVWTRVMKDDSQFTANVFHSIMKHVVYWAAPGFKAPASGSASAVSYTWPGLILEYLMPLRKIESVVEPVLPAEKNDPKTSAEIFVKAIWQHSSTYCRDFRVEEARSYVSFHAALFGY